MHTGFHHFFNLSRTFWILILSTKMFPAPFILRANIITPRFIPLFKLVIKISTTVRPKAGVHKIPSESLLQTNSELLITAPWVQLLNFVAELLSGLFPQLSDENVTWACDRSLPKIKIHELYHFSLLCRACYSVIDGNCISLTIIGSLKICWLL